MRIISGVIGYTDFVVAAELFRVCRRCLQEVPYIRRAGAANTFTDAAAHFYGLTPADDNTEVYIIQEVFVFEFPHFFGSVLESASHRPHRLVPFPRLSFPAHHGGAALPLPRLLGERFGRLLAPFPSYVHPAMSNWFARSRLRWNERIPV